MSANLAIKYLREHGETLAEYDGLCGELANVLQMATPNSQLVSVSGIGVFDTTAWTFHTVVMVDGIVHDAWRKSPLPLRRWLQKFDCEWPIEIAIDGEEVFDGLVSELPEDFLLSQMAGY
jgi:hypothetical protein